MAAKKAKKKTKKAKTKKAKKRRYSKSALRALIESSPLRLDKIGYFNSLLFPLAVAERTASKLRGKDDADLTLPPGPLNAALERAFAAERHLIGRVPLPPERIRPLREAIRPGRLDG